MACAQVVASSLPAALQSAAAVPSSQRLAVSTSTFRPIRSLRVAPVCSARKNDSAAQSARSSSNRLRLLSAPVAALPLVLAFVEAELPHAMETVTTLSDFHISEGGFKAFYMIFSCVFCWGALVFGSMNDDYYESDEYRNAGGNGTQFWIYQRAEEEEEAAREELWRDELRKEIEEKVTGVKSLKSVREEELV
eukprot:TRINITY_DN3675_c0_g1_i1.p1 TRINITY_DN3675_c0_g1~~TRINITY_DN3675_c0_g1_i1.p1  ORF type:complete len:193 (+),score=3.66 TRINITY_DN3675_c0_g1_i1:132-710(+)